MDHFQRSTFLEFPHTHVHPFSGSYLDSDATQTMDANQTEKAVGHSHHCILDSVGNGGYIFSDASNSLHMAGESTTHDQVLLQPIEHSTNGIDFPCTLNSDDFMPAYRIGGFPGGDMRVLAHGLPFLDGYSMSSGGWNRASILPPSPPYSESDVSLSPRSSYLDSATCYPPLEGGYYDEPDQMYQTPDYSVALCQVHSHPDMASDFSTVGECDNTGETESSKVAAISDTRTSPDSLVKYGRMSRQSKSGRPSPNRIVKKRQSSSPKTATNSNNRSPTRVFTCSFSHYGCPSVFVSKNEWKRHVTSQHLQLGFYRCDVGACNVRNQRPPSPTSTTSNKGSPEARRTNDFNRKDLFTQHQRRMHAPWLGSSTRQPASQKERNGFERSLEQVRRRCWHEQRRPPAQSQCGFCGMFFSGPRSWDERMEHVGRHFERDEAGAVEKEDVLLREWAIHEGVISLGEDGELKLTYLLES